MTRTLLLPLVASIAFCTTAQAQPTVQAQTAGQAHPAAHRDSTRKDHFHYYALHLLSGVGFQVGNRFGLLGVSFPYTITDASGNTSSYIFTSQPRRARLPVRADVIPMGFEMGGRKFFGQTVVSFGMERGYGAGTDWSTGAGANWYWKTIEFKTSINLVYYSVNKCSLDNLLGSISDSGKTVHLLNEAPGPTFIESTRYGVRGPYNATHLDITYGQAEWAVQPRVSIQTNDMHHHARLEFDLGYSIPFSDRGFIDIYEDDGNNPTKGHTDQKGAPVSIGNPGLTAVYNGKVIHSAPYHYGLYLGLQVILIGHK